MIKPLVVLSALATIAFAPAARADVLIEGFESGNLSAYTAIGGNPQTATVSAASAHDGSFGLGFSGPADLNWYLRTDAAATLAQGNSFYAWMRVGDASTSGGREYFGFGSSTGATYAVVLGPNTGQLVIQEDNPTSGSFGDLASVSQSYVANQWYKVGVTWGVGGLITVNLYGSDGVTLLNSVSATNNDITSGGIAFRGFTANTGPLNSIDTVTKLAPVPEPSSLVLVSCGIVGLIGLKRRRRA